MTAAKDVLFESLDRKHETIGSLRLARYDDILGDEEHEVDAQVRGVVHFRLHLFEVTRKVTEATPAERYPTRLVEATEEEAAHERQMTKDEFEEWVLNTLTSDQWLKYGEMFRPYLDDITMLFSLMPDQIANKDKMVHVALLSRAEVQVDGEWQPLKDWTMEDTRKLPRRIRNQIQEFMAKEHMGWEPSDKSGAAAAEGGKPAGKGKAAS
jgi:hypothetical protein